MKPNKNNCDKHIVKSKLVTDHIQSSLEETYGLLVSGDPPSKLEDTVLKNTNIELDAPTPPSGLKKEKLANLATYLVSKYIHKRNEVTGRTNVVSETSKNNETSGTNSSDRKEKAPDHSQLQTGPTSQLQTGPTSQLQTGPTSQLQTGPTSQLQTGPTSQLQAGPTGQLQTGPTGQLQTGPTGQLQTGPTSQLTVEKEAKDLNTRREGQVLERAKSKGERQEREVPEDKVREQDTHKNPISTKDHIQEQDISKDRVQERDISKEQDSSVDMVQDQNTSNDKVQDQGASKDQVQDQDASKDQVKEQGAFKDQVEKRDTSKEEVKKLDTSKDQVKKRKTSKDQVKKRDTFKEEVKRLDTSKEKIKKLDTSKDQVKKRDTSKDQVKKRDTYKEEVKRLDTSKDQVKDRGTFKDKVLEDTSHTHQLKLNKLIGSECEPVPEKDSDPETSSTTDQIKETACIERRSEPHNPKRRIDGPTVSTGDPGNFVAKPEPVEMGAEVDLKPRQVLIPVKTPLIEDQEYAEYLEPKGNLKLESYSEPSKTEIGVMKQFSSTKEKKDECSVELYDEVVLNPQWFRSGDIIALLFLDVQVLRTTDSTLYSQVGLLINILGLEQEENCSSFLFPLLPPAIGDMSIKVYFKLLEKLRVRTSSSSSPQFIKTSDR